MSTATKLLTVEEFQKIPNPPGGVYELYHGEPVFVGYPEGGRQKVRFSLRRALQGVAGESWVVLEECPFRPAPEHQLWAADVAAVAAPRFWSIRRWLEGAPELVIEVLSPSNTATQMLDKARICLRNGAIQFWEADPQTASIRVTRRGGTAMVYSRSETIPLDEIFGEGQIAVDDIFPVEGA